jgi:hypothetical protein
MNWSDEPATERQLLLLKESGYIPTTPLSLTEAARLIRHYQRHPNGQPAREPNLRPATPPPQEEIGTRTQGLSHSANAMAYQLHQAVDRAQQALKDNPEGPNVRADAVATKTRREQFWLDTCREVGEMHAPTVQLLEFYQNFGCRFTTPTLAQVQEVLDALDHAMSSWDQDHPELFYQTLELNFPELVRHR